MDLIFKRYSSPFFFINEMIKDGQLDRFVDKILDITNDEKIYDIWLHRVYGQSFNEFRDSLNVRRNVNDEKDYTRQKVDVSEVVAQSMDVLNVIKPN